MRMGYFTIPPSITMFFADAQLVQRACSTRMFELN